MRFSQTIINHPFIRFIGMGGLNTLATYLLYFSLVLFFNYQIAYTISYIFGIFFAYWLNLKIVFQTKGNKKKLFLFPFVYLLQYGFGLFIMYIWIQIFSFNQLIAPLIVALLSVPLTYVLSKIILK